MVKVYRIDEILQEHLDAMKIHNIDTNKVKYIIIPDGILGSLEVVMKLGREFVLLSTESGIPFYVLYKSIDN